MAKITVNGHTITGNNISINGNKIIVDGFDFTPESKNVMITINGDITSLDVDVCDSLTVTGNVGSLATQSGDVDINGNVTGSVQTMSGDVSCIGVGGSINTMSGDIKYEKKEPLPTDEEKWFIETFNRIAEEHGNCETVKTVEINKSTNPKRIVFSVDMNRKGIHTRNEIIVRIDKFILMNLCEAIEGGDIESELKKEIERKYK